MMSRVLFVRVRFVRYVIFHVFERKAFPSEILFERFVFTGPQKRLLRNSVNEPRIVAQTRKGQINCRRVNIFTHRASIRETNNFFLENFKTPIWFSTMTVETQWTRHPAVINDYKTIVNEPLRSAAVKTCPPSNNKYCSFSFRGGGH